MLDRVMVNAAASRAVPHHAIALDRGISPDTLRRHYADELDGGAWLAVAYAEQTMFEAMRGPDIGAAVRAASFVLSRRSKEYRDVQDTTATPDTGEVTIRRTRADGSMVEVRVGADGSSTGDT